MTAGPLPRAALYVRIPREDQGSLDQVAELRRFCLGRGWEVIGVNYDADATSTEPPGSQLRALLRDARRGTFEVLLFWDLDCLAIEGTYEAIRVLDSLDRWGVDFVSYREPHLNTLGPSRDTLIRLVASFAGLERERRKQRIKAGLARARAQGKRLGRPLKIYPVEPLQIVHDRDRHASWGSIARTYGIPKTSVRRLYRKGLGDTAGRSEQGRGG